MTAHHGQRTRPFGGFGRGGGGLHHDGRLHAVGADLLLRDIDVDRQQSFLRRRGGQPLEPVPVEVEDDAADTGGLDARREGRAHAALRAAQRRDGRGGEAQHAGFAGRGGAGARDAEHARFRGDGRGRRDGGRGAAFFAFFFFFFFFGFFFFFFFFGFPAGFRRHHDFVRFMFDRGTFALFRGALDRRDVHQRAGGEVGRGDFVRAHDHERAERFDRGAGDAGDRARIADGVGEVGERQRRVARVRDDHLVEHALPDGAGEGFGRERAAERLELFDREPGFRFAVHAFVDVEAALEAVRVPFRADVDHR